MNSTPSKYVEAVASTLNTQNQILGRAAYIVNFIAKAVGSSQITCKTSSTYNIKIPAVTFKYGTVWDKVANAIAQATTSADSGVKYLINTKATVFETNVSTVAFVFMMEGAENGC